MKILENKVFLILSGANPLKRVPKQIFIAKDYNMAKLYFMGYLEGEKNPEDWIMYEIGTFNEKMEIKNCKKFICGGYEVTKQKQAEKQIYEQKKLSIKKDKECYENFQNGKSQTQIINELFDGTIIK